ncbi:MAG: Uma2 family endonuclease [Chloroflexi bacterium]|nr:Uma2 family endonuclease [Chloroflexota bacterium]
MQIPRWLRFGARCVVATQPERVILTYADYVQLPDDGKRYELLEGELEVTPVPSTGHQSVVLNLAVRLDRHVRQQRLGKVLIAPCDVLLSEIMVVQPDLLFVARERLWE